VQEPVGFLLTSQCLNKFWRLCEKHAKLLPLILVFLTKIDSSMHTEFVKTEGLLNTVNGIFCMQIVSDFNAKGTLNKIISNSFCPL